MQLDNSQLEAGMRVLEREQQALIPTRLQLVLYHMFNVAVGVLIGSFVARVVIESDAVTTVTVVSLFALLLLFVLNIPFAQKLRRHAKLRSRLGLRPALRPYFRPARRSLRGMLSDLLSLFFALIAFLFFLMFLYSSYQYMFGTRLTGRGFPLFLLIFSLVLLLPLLLLSLMRRAKLQLDVVTRLQSTLSQYAQEASDRDAALDIPAEEYQIIAELERDHLIQDHHSSLQVGGQEGQAPEYSAQQSSVAREAMGRLNPTVRRKVEEEIYSLMLDPSPSGVAKPSADRLHTVQIPETQL